MRKLLLLMISILVVCLFSGFASLRSQQQKPGEDNEVATPVVEDALTPQQREHSKLYEQAYKGREKIRDRLIENPGGISSHRISCPVVYPERAPNVVEELAPKADAVVITTFVSKSSQITSDGTYIFTDYQLQIEEILKNVGAGTLNRGAAITVTRPGGRVLLYGRLAAFTDSAFRPLMPGHRYLMFLSYLPSTGTYRAINHESTFDISDAKVETLSEATAKYFERDLAAFITSVKSAIAHSLNEGRKQ